MPSSQECLGMQCTTSSCLLLSSSVLQDRRFAAGPERIPHLLLQQGPDFIQVANLPLNIHTQQLRVTAELLQQALLA